MAKLRLSQFGSGSIIHIVHRGTRGSNIVKDHADKWHFLLALYFLNDKATNQRWKNNLDLKFIKSVRSDLTDFKEIRSNVGRTLGRNTLDDRNSYVDILAYCLMPNHFHLLVYIKEPEDVSKFMQRLSTSLAMRYNKRYKTKGSLFESRFKVSVLKKVSHFNIVLPYILYKNPCELFQGGIKSAIKNYDKAFRFSSNYKFCSLGDLTQTRPQSPIINRNRLNELFEIPKGDKNISRWCRRYLIDRPDNNPDADFRYTPELE
jgi:REP element-mobilizing transposase RayT